MTSATRQGRPGGRRRRFRQVISLRLPDDLYDAYIVAALRRGVDVSVLMRDVLQASPVVQNAARDQT